MTWRSFMDFVLMLEMRQEDAIVRNYDLDNLNGTKPGIMLDRAFARMGFDQPHTLRAHVLPTIAAHMQNMGYKPPPSSYLHVLCLRWYIWDRIRKGEVRQWPLKQVNNPLL